MKCKHKWEAVNAHKEGKIKYLKSNPDMPIIDYSYGEWSIIFVCQKCKCVKGDTYKEK